MNTESNVQNVLRKSLGRINRCGLSPSGDSIFVVCDHGYALLNQPDLQFQYVQGFDRDKAIINFRWIDDKLHLLVYSAGVISLMYPEDKKIIWNIEVETTRINAYSWSADNNKLACVTQFNIIKVWDISGDSPYGLGEWKLNFCNGEQGSSTLVNIDDWSADSNLLLVRYGRNSHYSVALLDMDNSDSMLAFD